MALGDAAQAQAMQVVPTMLVAAVCLIFVDAGDAGDARSSDASVAAAFAAESTAGSN